MPIAASAAMFISVPIVLFIFSIGFKLAGKLRLTIPVLYAFIAVMSTYFTDWTGKHDTLVLIGLGVVTGLTVLSWIVSLVKKIRNKKHEHSYYKGEANNIRLQLELAHWRGINVNGASLNENGELVDSATGKPLL